MSIEGGRAWLVSCPNRNGGVFLLDGDGVERLSMVETTGMAIVPDGVLWARQSDDANQLRRLSRGACLQTQLADHPLDVHDVLWHDGHVLAVYTELNTVARLDADLREVERWTLPGERDASHLNSICIHEGRLLATRFCASERRRGYKDATRGAGEVIDVETREVLLAGLSQPHSLTSHDGMLWLCDSETRALRGYRDGTLAVEQAFDGYTRGLAFDSDRILLGLSRSRNEPSVALGNARLLELDARTLEVRSHVDLPADEIYDVCRFDGDAMALRQAAMAEANTEVASIERRRVSIESELVERDQRLGMLNHRLEQAFAAHAASEAHVTEALRRATALRIQLADADAQAQEAKAWIGMLEPEIERLRAIISGHERVVDEQAVSSRVHERVIGEQASALAVLQDYVDLILGSRSWRYTRMLRRREPERPLRLHPESSLEFAAPVDLGFVPADPEAGPRRSDLPILGIEFPASDQPLVSIVVTAFGRFEQTLACLRAILHAGTAATCEVILIEDGSGDADMARFRIVPSLRYHENAATLGFLRSANQAHALARGEYIHFLNNDTLVQPGWLDALLATFTRFHDCGIAGSKLLYPDGRLQEAGGIVWSDASGCNIGRDDDPEKPEYAYAHEVDYVSGASLLLRADVFRHLGGFDERYAPAYYEDTDLAFRIREFGRKVYFQPASVVFHHEGLSHGTDADSGIKAFQPRNRDKFLERWGAMLAHGQMPPGAHPFLARDRAQLAKTVLVVDRYPPRTDRDAGSRAIWQLMRVLHLQGMSIKFWAHDPDFDAVYADNLRLHGIQLLRGEGGTAAFEAWIAEHGRYLDYVVLSRPTVAAEHIDTVRRHSAAKVVYYGHDVHSLRFVSQRRVDPDPLLAGFAHHARLVEEKLWLESDLVLYPAEGETRHVRKWLEEQDMQTPRAETIPLFAYEPIAFEVGDGLSHRRNVLFVGGFSHAPNIDAALWFVRRVWPIVHRECPEHRLCLVGADPPDEISALARSDVLVTGHVPEHELVAYYYSARAVVAPLRFGAGVKGKVLEAMRYGVPCVTTSVGAQGLEDAGFLRVSDDVGETARKVIALLRDDESWMEAARAGLAFIEARYSVASVWETLSTVVDPTPYADVAARLRAIEGEGRP